MATVKPISKSKMARGKILFYACIVALPILQFVIFYIGVNLNSFILAFQSWDGEKNAYTWNKVGALLDNFKKVINDFSTMQILKTSLKNSLVLFVIGVLFGSTLALLFSYYIYKKHRCS